MKHAFVIDDTGSPGSPYESATLKNDKKTYVAVFIAADIREELLEGIKALLISYKDAGIQMEEFHFTDLINRRRAYKILDTKTVTAIFEDFTNLLCRYRLPYFIQSMTPRTLAENGMSLKVPKTLDEQALDFLVLRMVSFVKNYQLQNSFEVFIDEGLEKSGQQMRLPLLASVAVDPVAVFQASHENLLIQVADFFAFVHNRNQIMAIKDKRTHFDHEILHIVNKVFQGNESSGNMGKLISEKDFTKSDYDQFQMDMLKKFGVYEYWSKVNEK